MCPKLESFNIYKNTQLKKAKYANKHLLEILNTQLKFEIQCTQMNEKGVSNILNCLKN